MRETVHSLRIYLVLCGVWGTAANLLGLVSSRLSPFDILAVASFVASVCLIYLGIRLRPLLKDRVHHALAILYLNMAVGAVALVLCLVVGARGVLVGQLGVALLILWYIRANVMRLAAQEVSGIGVAA